MPDPAHTNPEQSVSSYPREDGDVIVLGPQVFAAKDGSVLNWRGANYTPQPAPTEPTERETLALGWLSAEMAERADAWAGNAPEWFPEPPEWLQLWAEALAATEEDRRS